MRRRTSEQSRGSAGVEVLVMAFVVMWVVLIGLQIFSVMYAGQAAGRAAWDAARAQSMGQSATGAANASVPGAVSVESVSTAGDGITVTVRTAEFLPFMEIGPISRTAYVP